MARVRVYRTEKHSAQEPARSFRSAGKSSLGANYGAVPAKLARHFRPAGTSSSGFGTGKRPPPDNPAEWEAVKQNASRRW
jgi:hypothetical protein